MFADQRAALENAGFTTSLCPDSAIHHNKPLRNLPPASTVVYRGWMLNAADYTLLTNAITSASATPLTSPATYLLTHHLPNWYPLIADFTPETRILPLTADFESELRALNWNAFFIKDYVKSLKTSRGSIIRDPSEITTLVEEMKSFRGDIEGGLCARRVEPFLPDSERRYFVLHGRPFSPTPEPIPDLVHIVAPRIPSPFFSIDLILRTDGLPRIVELGDGQVSDLVGWSPIAFASMWRTIHPPAK